jgi:N utilization substance protein B
MPRRSRAREVALQLLYEADRNPGIPAERDRQFVETRLRGSKVSEFALGLVNGVRGNRVRIDEIIQRVAQNWTLGRMTPIDRSVLRLATFEILFSADTPPKVAINEAIELAKRFGTAESPRFVNGILDRIITEHPRNDNPDGAGQGGVVDQSQPTEMSSPQSADPAD